MPDLTQEKSDAESWAWMRTWGAVTCLPESKERDELERELKQLEQATLSETR